MFRDGHAMYAWQGLVVPPYVILDPGGISVADIESERNVEVRRVKMSRYGESRYLLESGSKVVDTSDFGTLYRKDLPFDEPLCMVQVVNASKEPDGTRRRYFLRVPPHVMTAREAVAWTFGLRGEDYAPTAQS